MHGLLVIHLILGLSLGVVSFNPLDSDEQLAGLNLAQPQPSIYRDLPVGVRHEAVGEQTVFGVRGHLPQVGLARCETQRPPQFRCRSYRLQVQESMAHLVVILEPVPVEHLLPTVMSMVRLPHICSAQATKEICVLLSSQKC